MKNVKKVAAASILGLTVLASPIISSVSPVSSPIVQAATTSFKDVSASFKYYKAITELADKGVIKGFSDGTFKPTKQVTRAEFASFIARALNLPAASSSFSDVPKSAALYDGVSRAYKAGIIKGVGNNKFNPSQGVSRLDMAVMLDRALQLKGSYTKTKVLNFSDNASIGAYAKTSVQRMYHYNIMGAYSGSKFAGTTVGNRGETAQSIYNMLTVINGGQATPTTPTKPPVNKSYKDMTLAELKAAYPEYNHVIVERQWKPEMKIVVRDMMQEYHTAIHTSVNDGGLKEFADGWTPKEWFDFTYPGYVSGFASNYIHYPMREVIAYNGVSYKQSKFFVESIFLKGNGPGLIENMPEQPAEKGQFLIDIHRYDNDFVVYRHEDVKWDELGANPVEKDRGTGKGSEYIVDLHAAFKYATGVTMAQGGLQIAYNGSKIVLSANSKKATVNGKVVQLTETVTYKNGKAYGPIREIAKHIGLHTRASDHYKRFEISNFQLEYPNLWLE